VTRPCSPSPCGPNSICRELNEQAVCTCAPEFLGSPPLCRPECTLSSDCRQNEACANQKCRDPCPGTCGIQARCMVVNHNPVCSCPESYTGDPFIRCDIMSKTISAVRSVNPLTRGSLKLRSIVTLSRTSDYPASEPLPTLALRSVRSVPGHQRSTVLLVLTRVQGRAPVLST